MSGLAEFLHWSEYTKLLIGLLAISTPLAAVPIFLALTEEFSRKKQRQIALVAALTYTLLLLTFTYFSESILDLFGITLSAFKVAGGILLLLSSLDMMQSSPAAGKTAERLSNVVSMGIVPLAIPILAGPGAISTIIIYAHLHEGLGHKLLITGVIMSASIIIYGLFIVTVNMGSLFGQMAVTVINRIMGLIIGSIGVEFIMDGIAEHFPTLTAAIK